MNKFVIIDKNGNFNKENRWNDVNSENNVEKNLPIVSFFNPIMLNYNLIFSEDINIFANSTSKYYNLEDSSDFLIEIQKLNMVNNSFILLKIGNLVDNKLNNHVLESVGKISDIVVFNIFHQNIINDKTILKSYLNEIISTIDPIKLKTNNNKFKFFVCVHDYDDNFHEPETLKEIFVDFMKELALNLSNVNQCQFDDIFDISLILMENYKYNTEKFLDSCKTLKAQLYQSVSKISNCNHKVSDVIECFKNSDSSLKQSQYLSNDFNPNETEKNFIIECEKLYSVVLKDAALQMAELTKQVDENNKIPNFGAKSSHIVQDSLNKFDKLISCSENSSFVGKKKNELEAILDTSLNSIFLKQLNIIRELTINHFKTATANEDVPADFAFFTADSFFVREAEDSVRPGSFWTYSNERASLHSILREISNRRKQLISERIQHAEHTANAFQYLQMQQAQMQAIQQQQFGGGPGSWNIGCAYRPPDSNLNISMGYQQGRTNIQVSMIPDEQANLLGPNGFTSGVGPANLGLSLNLNL